MRISLIGAIVVGLIMTARPDSPAATGAWLLDTCPFPPSSGEFKDELYVMLCTGYFSGLFDASDWIGREACPPRGSEPQHWVRVVVAYLESHPEELHMSAASLAKRALVEAYPC